MAAEGAFVHGLDEIRKNLAELPADLERKILQRAVAEAAAIVKDDAAARVAYRTGKLHDAIRSRTAPGSRRRGTVTYNVAVRSRIAHLIEFGVAPHDIRPRSDSQRIASAVRSVRRDVLRGKDAGEAVSRGVLSIGGRFVAGAVRHPGFAARPFLRPAFDSNIDACMAAVMGHVRRALAAFSSGKWRQTKRGTWTARGGY